MVAHRLDKGRRQSNVAVGISLNVEYLREIAIDDNCLKFSGSCIERNVLQCADFPAIGTHYSDVGELVCEDHSHISRSSRNYHKNTASLPVLHALLPLIAQTSKHVDATDIAAESACRFQQGSAIAVLVAVIGDCTIEVLNSRNDSIGSAEFNVVLSYRRRFFNSTVTISRMPANCPPPAIRYCRQHRAQVYTHLPSPREVIL